MERGGFDGLRVEELRPDRVQNRVAHLMTADVGALAGEEGAAADGGVEEVEAAGKPFDPNLHEAVSQKETAEVPEGQVVQQLRKGYILRDRLLRRLLRL